ncbi:MAG: MBL fold metallo-hydrolase [Solobacterium sp.]|nr:MBL fold metallo-hydrolase [Solobacterium sp.]
MGMKSPFICEIAKNTYAVNEFGMDAIYLCIGSERALLIDTGTGMFDVKALAERLTDKPYDVVLTHGHVDHAGGMDLFEQVYLHRADFEAALSLTYEERVEYAKKLRAMDTEHAYDAEADAVRRWNSVPQLIPVGEGHVFDLGDRTLEVFHTPGHTPGSVSLLDRKNRILFSGDACNVNTLCLGSPVSVLKKTAEKIKGLEPYFDRDYNGHNGYAGMPDCFSQPDSVHDDVIEACRQILGKETEPEKVIFLGRNCLAVTSGCARVVFYPENAC